MRLLVVVVFNFIIFSFLSSAMAGDFKWSGSYRFEGLSISNPELSGNGRTKSYMLHHLILRPEIVAYDGVVIKSRFDLFNNEGGSFANQALGQTFGSGVNTNLPTSGTSEIDTNTLSQAQASESLRVNELYAVWKQEFGTLIVGRAPIHFGLGMTFNNGYGPFDHYFDTRDMVGYKLMMGNFMLMPVLAKVNEGQLNRADDVNDYILHAQYENPETELTLGAIFQWRRSGSAADSNDTPLAVFTNAGSVQGNFEVDYYNFFVSQWVDSVKIAFELGFADGNTGVFNNGQEVNHKGFGALVNMNYVPQGASWKGLLSLGYASGNDPTTQNTYEGYSFDRNLDVAFLMFNHPMGQADFLTTSPVNGLATSQSASSRYDDEAIGNALFGSIGFEYFWNSKWGMQPQLTYAQLVEDPLNKGVASGLGVEADFSLKYKPTDGFQWITRFGAFMPGDAFSGGSNNFGTDTSYGIETKAAISF